MWLLIFIILLLLVGVGGAIKGVLWLLLAALVISALAGAIGGPRYWR